MSDLVGCRDPTLWGLRGIRGGGAATPNVERRPLSVVPDARRAGGNIKMLPLISHKTAANRTDALKVLAAWGRRQAPFLLGAAGPLRCVTLGATLCPRTNGRRGRNPSTRNVRQSR